LLWRHHFVHRRILAEVRVYEAQRRAASDDDRERAGNVRSGHWREKTGGRWRIPISLIPSGNIVWSYEERAQYLPKNLPSGFPYFASIGQYWKSYCFICGLTQSRHQFNFGDHLSSMVLGGSFALEYSIRGAYEQTIGRLSDGLVSHELVEEDAYAARVAREYADFVYIRPFTNFILATRLRSFGKKHRCGGKHPIRKWERKFILSVDFGIEAVYAHAMLFASHVTYGAESDETYTWVENVPETCSAIFRESSGSRKSAGDQPAIVRCHHSRYQEFTDLAVKLAERDVHFLQVAGNDEIMVTVVVPNGWTYDLRQATGRCFLRRTFSRNLARNASPWNAACELCLRSSVILQALELRSNISTTINSLLSRIRSKQRQNFLAMDRTAATKSLVTLSCPSGSTSGILNIGLNSVTAALFVRHRLYRARYCS